MYGMILVMCLLDGHCYETIPAVYTIKEECVAEVAHQRAQGMPKQMLYCDELKEGE